MSLHSKIESGMIPSESSSSLVQTIRRQVLKRGRGRPRKLKSEKTVLEEEIVRKSDEEMGDIKGIDEENLLTIKDMLMERDNSGYSSDQSFLKENKEDDIDFVFGPIDKDLSISRKSTGTLKRTVENSFGFTLDPILKTEVDSSSCQNTSLLKNNSIEKRKKTDSMVDNNECYMDISREDYILHNKNRFGAMTLVDKMFHRNASEVGLGVKYHTLREMEINDYDKVPKTEEAIYGSRPNVYTRFIEENKDMFMNDCSLKYVFDEVGNIRKFPLYSEYNSFK